MLITNLIKGTLRSLKSNKLNIISMTFLVFAGSVVYTAANDTTNNIQQTYNNICKSSNLHDFTVNELYRLGTPQYGLCSDSSDSTRWSTGESSEGDTIPWAVSNMEDTNNNFTRIYCFDILYTDDQQENSMCYSYWTTHKNDPIFHPSLTLYSSVNLTYWSNSSTHQSTQTKEEIDTELNELNTEDSSGLSEYGVINAFIEQSKQALLDKVNNEPTPMQEYLDSDAMNSKVKFRKFNAIDITSSSDNVLYKMIQSEPTDEIDKIHLFNGTNLFSSNTDPSKNRDFNPLNSYTNEDGAKYSEMPKDDGTFYSNEELISTPMVTLNGLDKQTREKIEAKILLLSLSDDVDSGLLPTFESDIIPLSQSIKQGIYISTWNTEDHTDLINKYNDFIGTCPATSEVFTNKTYRYILQWTSSLGGTGAVPHSWQMDLWTSKFAVCAPQYLKKTKKQTMPSSMYITNYTYKDLQLKSPLTFKDFVNTIPYKDSLLDTPSENGETITLPNGTQYTYNYNDYRCARTFNHWYELINNYHDQTHQSGQYTLLNNRGIDMPFIIIGQGISANFAYPIFDLQHVVPNYKKEAMVFINTDGYRRTYDAFKSSYNEQYLVGKFLVKTNKQQILDDINNSPIKTNQMIYPSNIKIAYMNNDTSNILSPAALRIAFIPNLISSIRTIQILLTAFLIFISVLICIFMINNYIKKLRVQLGVMRANGIKRRSTILSFLPLSIIPSVFGGVIGYMVGTLLQGLLLALFSNFWQLPTALTSYNPITFIVMCILPMLIFYLTTVIVSGLILRQTTSELMKYGSEFKVNLISLYIKKPFKQTSILSRFRLSFAFNSMWKLITLSIMSALAMATITFTLSIKGTIKTAQQKTYDSQQYAYAIDLITPTNQGGQYIPIDSNYIGENGMIHTVDGNNFMPNNLFVNNEGQEGTDQTFFEYFNKNAFIETNNQTDGANWDSTETEHSKFLSKMYYEKWYFNPGLSNHVNKWQSINGGAKKDNGGYDDNGKYFANMLYPTASDSIGEGLDINYLKNRSMTKAFLNMNVGMTQLSYLSSNPWDIAQAMMPENNRNTADERYKDIVNQIGFQAQNSTNQFNRYKDFFTSTPNNIDQYTLNTSKTTFTDEGFNAFFGQQISPEFINFENKLYNPTATLMDGKTTSQSDYNICYNQIPLNSDDETYTYLSCLGVENKTKDKNIKIIGIKPNSTHVYLKNKQGAKINKKLNEKIDMPSIIINEFAAKKYGLHKGDILNLQIQNKANRYDNILNSVVDNTTHQFKIVDISQSFTKEEFFINQDVANYLLGLRNHIDPHIYPHTWYYDYKNALYNKLETPSPMGLGSGLTNVKVMYDISDSKYWQNPRPADVNCVPYGFNGVFTNNSNGGPILNSSFPLYSPSGLYPAMDDCQSDAAKQVFGWGANVAIAANIIDIDDNNTTPKQNPLGQEIHDAYVNYLENIENQDTYNTLKNYAPQLLDLVSNTFGRSFYNQMIQFINDKVAQQTIYSNIVNIINALETLMILCVLILTILITFMLSFIVINTIDNLAAILKALGYTDKQNIFSFLSSYIPVIIIGLLISTPLSFALIYGLQTILFSSIGILIEPHISFIMVLISFGCIGVLYVLSLSIGLYKFKKEKLVTKLKTI